MSLLTLRTQNLSWQDRTINIELMVAPARTHLLYNKHKGLRNKCVQVAETLDKEKSSFLRSYKTDQRLMERKKEWYSQRRIEFARRSSIASRRSSQTSVSSKNDSAGRISAPPRLQNETVKSDDVFLTQLGSRGARSAGARCLMGLSEAADGGRKQNVSENKVKENELSVSLSLKREKPVSSARSRGSPTPGKPHLIREKSVRFLDNGNTTPTSKGDQDAVPEVDLSEKIQQFLFNQNQFNKGLSDPLNTSGSSFRKTAVSSKGRRRSSVHNGLLKLESAFDDFCEDSNPDKLQHLVKFATKLKLTVRGLRAGSIIPPVASKSVTMVI